MAYLWEPVIVFAVYEQHPAEVFLITYSSLSQGFCFRTAKDIRRPDELGNGHEVFREQYLAHKNFPISSTRTHLAMNSSIFTCPLLFLQAASADSVFHLVDRMI